MPFILQAVLDFWRQYPERQLGEVILLAARQRRKAVVALRDDDLAAVLRIWTVSDDHRDFLRENHLPSLDPWTISGEGPAPQLTPAASAPRHALAGR
jgi:hypothetical protein